MKTIRIAVFASGNGSNLKAIHKAVSEGSLPRAEISLIISNNSQAGAMAYAAEQGIPALHLSAVKFGGDQEMLAKQMLDTLQRSSIDLIVLAGYMKKLPETLIAAYPHRIINIHPALLPKHGGAGMYGLHVHEAVLRAGESETGATVHYVDNEYDSGAIILQETCEVLPDDTAETLARRVRDVEHRLYPRAIAKVIAALGAAQNK